MFNELYIIVKSLIEWRSDSSQCIFDDHSASIDLLSYTVNYDYFDNIFVAHRKKVIKNISMAIIFGILCIADSKFDIHKNSGSNCYKN